MGNPRALTWLELIELDTSKGQTDMQPTLMLLNLYNQAITQKAKSRKVRVVTSIRSHNPTQSPNISHFSDSEHIN